MCVAKSLSGLPAVEEMEFNNEGAGVVVASPTISLGYDRRVRPVCTNGRQLQAAQAAFDPGGILHLWLHACTWPHSAGWCEQMKATLHPTRLH